MNYNGKEYKEFGALRDIVHSLKLRTPAQWIIYWEENDFDDIPRNPNIVYESDGWISWEDFLGSTKAYLPFSECREIVRAADPNTVFDWKEYCKSGYKPDNIPDNPHIIYHEFWQGWNDFLGTNTKKYLSFSECRFIAREYEFKSIDEWNKFCKSEDKPYGIPDEPEIFYEEEWKGWEDFLGIETEKTLDLKYPKINKIQKSDLFEDTHYIKYSEAIKIVSQFGFTSISDWFEYCKSGRKPNYIPENPQEVYRNHWLKDEQWNNWSKWLGIDSNHNIKFINKFLHYEDAVKFLKNLQIKTIDEWMEYVKSGNKPINIPFNPQIIYKNNGWKGWRLFFGGGTYYFKFSEKETWELTKKFIKENNIRGSIEWAKLSVDGKIPINIPTNLPYYQEWNGWINFNLENYEDFKYENNLKMPFEEAVVKTRALGLKNCKEWFEYRKKYGKIDKIPYEPQSYYKCDWKGWSYWLGSIHVGKSKQETAYLLDMIKNELEFLDSAELLIIIEKFGLSKKLENDYNFLNIIKFSPFSLARKLNAKILRKKFSIKVSVLENSINSEIENLIKNDNNKPEYINEIKHFDDKINEYSKLINSSEINNLKLPEANSIFPIKSFDNQYVVAYLDDENFNFLIDYRIQKLWNELVNNKFKIEDLENETGGKYFTHIKHEFINQYYDVVDLQLPEGYCFENNKGNILEPNLMQKLTAYKIRERKKFGNWSEAGSGKTLAAVLTSRYINAKNNLIIAFNSTIDYWEKNILNAFPDSVVNTKKKDEIVWIEGQHNYLILNYEFFQQEYSEDFTNYLLDEIDFDFIVIDEIQNAKQREMNTFSKRKGLIHKILLKSEEKNPDISFLFMSCAPIINNLREPIQMLEMLNGVSYSELSSKLNINNAIEIYKHFVINGIRFTSSIENIEVKEKIIKIDGSHLVDKIKWLPANAILEIEQTLMNDKLKSILSEIEPGTMIYTYYVQDIVDNICKSVQQKGLSVGLYTGYEKNGLQDFIDGNVDVLIGSYPISVGVDGIQKICNKMIVLTLPWTSSEYENLIGRIKRQGSVFEEVEIIIPQVEIKIDDTKTWSWDIDRFDRIKFKRTLSDTALDGIVPEDKLPSRSEMVQKSIKSIQEWIERVENDTQRTIERKKLVLV